MSQGIETIVVVPCYNEEKRIDCSAFTGLVSNAPHTAILFVNDGSRDNTSRVLGEMAQQHPSQIWVSELAENSGKAEAVRHGMLRALAREPRLVGFWDADLAVPLEVIDRFEDVFRRRPGIDLVVGSRIPLLGHVIERSFLRQMLSPLFARSASIALGIGLRDTQCGAKMFRVVPGLSEVFAKPFSSRWIFDVELLARIFNRQSYNSLRNVAYEFPLESWREPGGSKLCAWDYFRAGYELSAIFLRYRLFPKRSLPVRAVALPDPHRRSAKQKRSLNAA